MENYFVIKMKLPSLNEVINKNRTNRHLGAKFKKDIEEYIGFEIKQALTIGTLKPVENPCEVYIEWHESTKRRDVDNVQSSQKFIMDSLVSAGVIKDDGRRYVKQIYHEIVDDNTDFVFVRIEQ